MAVKKEGIYIKWLSSIFRALVFFFGDLKLHRPSPSPITWAKHDHLVKFDEIDYVKRQILEPGDIVIHRDNGYASNAFISGVGIHAGVYLGHFRGKPFQLIEAISEGVVIRSASYILHTDYFWVLRPKKGVLSGSNVLSCIKKACLLEGFKYDYLFNFNTEEQWKLINEYGPEEAMNRGVRICCTEVVALAFCDYLEELGIYPTRNDGIIVRVLSLLGLVPGRYIYHADSYITAPGLDLVYVSESVTRDFLNKNKATLEMEKIHERYWGIRN